MKTIKLTEEQLHELALLFIEQFPVLEPLSLDEFLDENAYALYPEQLNLGKMILRLFDEL